MLVLEITDFIVLPSRRLQHRSMLWACSELTLTISGLERPMLDIKMVAPCRALPKPSALCVASTGA